MNNDHNKQSRDVLDQMAEVVRSWPVPDGPPMEIRRAVLALPEKPLRPNPRFVERTEFMKTIIKLAPLAAAAVIVLGFFAWPFGGNTRTSGVAFADVQRQLDTARTVTYRKVREENGKVVGEAKITAELPGRVRTDSPDGSYSIRDYSTGQNIQLKMSEARMMIVEVKPQTPPDLLAELRQMIKCDSPRELGEKQVDGRKAKGYQLAKDGDTLELWIDAATALPIRATVDRPTSRIIVRDFVFNAALDESVFSPTAPAGCRVARADMNPEHASEKDVLEALKDLAEHHAGSFPDQKLGDALIQDGNDLQAYLKDRSGSLPKQEVQRLEDEIQLKGALAFRVMQFNRGKWNYDGRGVKLGDAGKPVFWYKPQDAGKYRVVFGNLSVKDLDASQLPMHEPEAK